MARELPILIASVGHDEAAQLEDASRVGRHVWVALKWPPAKAGPHLLEVYRPAIQQPLRLLAEPLGTTGPQGHALRLYPYDDEEQTIIRVPASPDQLVGRPLAGGRFEILSVLGEGSIGAVYRARHTGLGIDVAVKVLHEAFQRDLEFCRRFEAEALALSRLDHPNLVHVYDFGQEPDGLLYIAMTLVQGQTLRTIQTRERRFDPKRAVMIMLQVSAGLGHAHSRGLIHRDVKPDNVMMLAKADDDGNQVEIAKVLDFGFAIPPDVSADVAQRLAGTPVYMSPEQCLGEELDARTDVYACGIMLYELLTGKVPFLSRNAEDIHRMHIERPAPRLSASRPDVDPRLDRLVDKALSKSRDARHPNMQELRVDLRTLLGDAAVSQSIRVGEARRSMPSIASIPPLPPLPPPPAPAAELAALPPSAPPPSVPPEAVADALAADAPGWLGALATERDPRAFPRRFRDLGGGIRVLARRGAARTLQTIAPVVAALEDKLGALQPPDEDAAAAVAEVARAFADPEVLAPLATLVLTQEDETERAPAVALLGRAAVHGAYALYVARAKAQADGRARIAFVKTMKSLGEPALPVLRAGLERIFPSAVQGEHRGAVELAEDLLLAMPAAQDEFAGHLVVRFAASPVATLCRAAARALPRVWGDRARPVLSALLEREDDAIRVAAIVGLREIDAVDHEVVERLGLFVGSTSPQVRAVVRAALEAAQGDARNAAAKLLAQLGP